MAMQTIDIKVAGNGRMILPASVRKAMGVHGDAKVILTIEDDQVRLSPIGHGVSRAQASLTANMPSRRARLTTSWVTERPKLPQSLMRPHPVTRIGTHNDVRRP